MRRIDAATNDRCRIAIQEIGKIMRRVKTALMLAAMMAASAFGTAQAESVVRYGISMADIPLTTGQPDRGAGAY
ncbi:hypothetical protein, partial [Rhodopseudomonas sp. B29]|uniref:hypothetical protein n=1 Tax=Rhodopseudomonas sp. B29 TaxID=95607 RepID=UPI0011D29B55